MSDETFRKDLAMLMQRVITLLEDPIVKRPATAADQEIRLMVIRLAGDLALLQAETGSRSPENIISVAASMQKIEKRYRNRKAVADTKKSTREFLFLLAVIFGWVFVRDGYAVGLIACLGFGALWAKCR